MSGTSGTPVTTLKLNVILADNPFLLSNICLCLASFCAYKLYEIWARGLKTRLAYALKQSWHKTILVSRNRLPAKIPFTICDWYAAKLR